MIQKFDKPYTRLINKNKKEDIIMSPESIKKNKEILYSTLRQYICRLG